MDMMPNRLTIGPVTIHMYGLMIGIGIMAAISVIERVMKEEKTEVKNLGNMILEVLVGGVVGARAYHVIDYWDYYTKNMGEILQVWNGGLGIFGAIIGGGAVLYVMGKKARVDWWELMDVTVMGLPLGQAIGRWGNFFNQELYGLPTRLPWGIHIRPENRLGGYEMQEIFHPLFLYESLGNLLLFGLMYWLWRGKKMKIGSGSLVAIYAVGYGLNRFVLEFLRIDSWMVGGVRVAQMVAVVMLAWGGGKLALKKGKL